MTLLFIDYLYILINNNKGEKGTSLLYRNHETSMAAHMGTLNVMYTRRGYHPDVDKEDNGEGEENVMIRRHKKGNELPIPRARAGRYIDTVGWEAILVFEGGNCAVYDILHKQVRYFIA